MKTMFIDMRFKKIIAEVAAIDARKIEVSYTADTEVEDDAEDNYYSASQLITATNNGAEIGKINFNYVKQEDENGEQEELIYLAYIEVNDAYRGYGISGMLYKKFGEVYSEKYNGLPVERHFENPIAEYSFKKAIEQGWVPDSALSEDKTTRQYDTEEKQILWQDLRSKLPENLQGPTANRRDLRKIIARSDLRKLANRMDLRKTANSGDVTIGPIDIETKQISNRMHKIEIRRDGELLGDMKYEVYPERDLVYINFVQINEPYRQNGLAMLLYKEFSKIYNSEYSGWRLSRKFVNPVAEYTFSKAVADGLFPDETLDNIRRDYNSDDEQLWYNELEPKLIDYRKKVNKDV